MTSDLVCSLGGQNILELKTRYPFLSETGVFEYGKLLATSAYFGLDIALFVFGGDVAAYATLAVMNAVVDVMVIDCDLIIIPLPLCPVGVVFFICWKLLHVSRLWLVGEWAWRWASRSEDSSRDTRL